MPRGIEPLSREVYNEDKHRYYHSWEQECYTFELRTRSDGHHVGMGIGNEIPYKNLWRAKEFKSDIRKFGLELYILKWKEPKAPGKKKKPESEQRTVTTERYDRHGNLLEKTMESRLVYTNSKGSFIKTRSSGQIYLSDPENGMIVYREKQVDGRGWDRVNKAWYHTKFWKFVLDTPEKSVIQ